MRENFRIELCDGLCPLVTGMSAPILPSHDSGMGKLYQTQISSNQVLVCEQICKI